MKTIQSAGKTLDIAVQNALDELGLSKEEVNVVVLQEGGDDKQFEVEVSPKLDETERIKEFLQQILSKMGLNCAVDVANEEDTIKLEVSGEDANGIIGYRGETLDALQYLCSLLLNEKKAGFKRVVIDTEGYRAKREKTLIKLANNLEQKVKRTGKQVELEPMNPYERRIIHSALQGNKFVETISEGEEPYRHVVVKMKRY